jgi:hypothetical protein
MTQPEVDGDEWLREIDRHPDLFDTALRIAVAMLTTGTIGPDGLDDISEEDVNEEVETLIAVGFLEDQVSIAWTPGDAEEHSLRLRFPFGHTDLGGSRGRHSSRLAGTCDGKSQG